MRDALARIVGAQNVLSDAACAEWKLAGVQPRAVAFPQNSAEVSQLLALASTEGWSVEPAGAGTYLRAGRTPARADVVLSTRRMQAVAEYEPADLTIAVAAGCPFDALQANVAANGQSVALDPARHERATIGALVSRADAGPARLAHGTPRDHVLGLELVTGDGRVLSLGGRVVKNVAGYDLVKLLVGAHGTLGVITRVNLRLLPIAEHDITLMLAGDQARLLDIVAALRDARILLDSLELLGPALAEQLEASATWTLLARVRTNHASAEDAATRIAQIAQDVSVARLSANEAVSVWSAVCHLEECAAVAVRLSQAPSALGETLAVAAGVLEGIDAHGGVMAHAGDGIVRVLVNDDSALPVPAAFAERIERARTRLAQTGGNVTVTCAPPALLAAVDCYGNAGPALRIMSELKKLFDPAGIMAPGRFIIAGTPQAEGSGKRVMQTR